MDICNTRRAALALPTFEEPVYTPFAELGVLIAQREHIRGRLFYSSHVRRRNDRDDRVILGSDINGEGMRSTLGEKCGDGNVTVGGTNPKSSSGHFPLHKP